LPSDVEDVRYLRAYDLPTLFDDAEGEGGLELGRSVPFAGGKGFSRLRYRAGCLRRLGFSRGFGAGSGRLIAAAFATRGYDQGKRTN
jgi:hypothetical protein